MSPRCWMYCWGTNRVHWLQYGWWPGNAACDDCRKIWDAHCEDLQACVDNRKWMEWDEALVISMLVSKEKGQGVN